MTIKQTFKDLANVQLMRSRVSSQKGKLTKLSKKVAELNHLIKDDILALVERTSTFSGNAYKTYQSAVDAISEKYNGTADWGVLQTGNIIDLRAAFIIGEGPKVVKKVEEADAEVEWVESFFEYNNIDNEVAQEFAKEAEIEGKLAIKLVVEEDKDKTKDKKKAFNVSARYVSWTENNYKIIVNPQDYMQYEKMVWLPTDKSKPETLTENQFVYKKFGGRINKPNLAAPKMMKCLTQVENLDRALRDWREIDNIFAAPILGVECKTAADVKSSQDALASKNWKAKKIFISTSKLYYAQFDIKGVESLEKEIMTLAKMISGTTGVPIQALGLPEFMSNRATAENLMEFVYASTIKERETWIGAYEEMIAKGMAMINEKTKKTPLDHEKIGIEIPIITEKHWQHLEKIYLPASVAGKISDEAFQEQVPGFDMEVEKKRREEKETSEFERIKIENENLKIDKTAQGIFKEEEE